MSVSQYKNGDVVFVEGDSQIFKLGPYHETKKGFDDCYSYTAHEEPNNDALKLENPQFISMDNILGLAIKNS